MTLGNGIDFIEIDRVRSIHNKFKKNFINKYFQNDEIKILSRGSANNFAIKEAFSKSLGLGFRTCYPNNISVSRDNLGKPFITPRLELKII